MQKFGFGDALSFMEAGLSVSLELDGKVRIYTKAEDKITCKIEGSYVSYPVTKFYLDAVNSKEWKLYE